MFPPLPFALRTKVLWSLLTALCLLCSNKLNCFLLCTWLKDWRIVALCHCTIPFSKICPKYDSTRAYPHSLSCCLFQQAGLFPALPFTFKTNILQFILISLCAFRSLVAVGLLILSLVRVYNLPVVYLLNCGLSYNQQLKAGYKTPSSSTAHSCPHKDDVAQILHSWSPIQDQFLRKWNKSIKKIWGILFVVTSVTTLK